MRRLVGIVGGGAAGMTAAISAVRQGAEVTILEGGDRIGRKILSTGNGKCNLGNRTMGAEWYYSGDLSFLAARLKQFGTEASEEFFRSVGLFVREINGGLYPMSEQASTVLDALRYELKESGVKVIENFRVDTVERRKESGGLIVKSGGRSMEFDSIVLCCGGKAAPKTGSDGSGYLLAESLGHSIVPVVPALVQLKCREEWLKSVAGVRAKAKVTLLRKGVMAEEYGEVQFTDYGISGIPVFQLSREVNYLTERGGEAELVIDFFPGERREGFEEAMLKARPYISGGRTVEEYFTGLLNKKLMLLMVKTAGLKGSDPVKNVPAEKLRKVYALCRELRVHATGNKGFENAQVCAGGVPLCEISERMESRKMPGVYFAGEILDVDGKCGGYNLHWAWCSGFLAGKAAAEASRPER